MTTALLSIFCITIAGYWFDGFLAWFALVVVSVFVSVSVLVSALVALAALALR